jgi:hypothetical protein
MRVLQLVGVLLIVAGALLLWKRPSYKTREDVVRIGEFKASVQQEQSVPPWLGLAGIGAGVALLLIGTRPRR